MKDPFHEIEENWTEYHLNWVLRAFAAGNTYRFLPKTLTAKAVKSRIRSFVGTGKILGRIRSETAFISFHRQLTNRLMSRNDLGFGRAVKLADLFLKEMITRRAVMDDQTAERISKWVNVPIDRVILKKLSTDYPLMLAAAEIKKNAALKNLKRVQYEALQAKLKKEAEKRGLNAIHYDLYWSNRKEVRARTKRQKK